MQAPERYLWINSQNIFSTFPEALTALPTQIVAIAGSMELPAFSKID